MGDDNERDAAPSPFASRRICDGNAASRAFFNAEYASAGRPKGTPKESIETVEQTRDNAILDQRLVDYRKNGSTISWMADKLGVSDRTIDRHFAEIDQHPRRKTIKGYLRRGRIRAYLKVRKSRQ